MMGRWFSGAHGPAHSNPNTQKGRTQLLRKAPGPCALEQAQETIAEIKSIALDYLDYDTPGLHEILHAIDRYDTKQKQNNQGAESK